MNNFCYFIANEYEQLKLKSDCEDNDTDRHGIFKNLKSLIDQTQDSNQNDEQELSDQDGQNENAKLLGLKVKKNKVRASCFVGQVWGPQFEESRNKVPITVLPKKPKRENSAVDPLQMAQECFRNSEIAKHIKIKKLFKYWPDEEPLQSHFDLDCVRFFVISFYLIELSKLCKRHLRNEFIRVQENLVSKVKGKILVHQNFRMNTVRGRVDRMCCQYQKHSLDSPENQILRAALEQCLKEIRRNHNMFQGTKVHEWSLHCDRALTGVTLRRISMSEFHSIKLGGLKKAYKKPIEHAKWILRLLGNDPSKGPEDNDRPETIYPFAINMNVLFERYCEALLRKSGECEVISTGQEFGDGINNVRPDFIVEKNHEYHVMDAKYKYDWKKDGAYRNDVFQVVAYTRHDKVKEMCSNKYPTKTIIMAPTMSGDGQKQELIQHDESFNTDYSEPKLELHHVNLPTR